MSPLVILLLMRGHSRGRKCPGTAAHSWPCVCTLFEPVCVYVYVCVEGGGVFSEIMDEAWGDRQQREGEALGLRHSGARCVP